MGLRMFRLEDYTSNALIKKEKQHGKGVDHRGRRTYMEIN